MKICIIDPNSFRNLGDYDKMLIENLKGESTLIGNIKFQYKAEGFRFLPLFSYSDKKYIFKLLSYVISIFKLYQFFLKKKFDVIHFQWCKIPHIDYLLIFYLKKYTTSKVIYTAHNILPHDTGVKFFKIYKKIYKKVDKIIVHTQITKDELIGLFELKNENIEVIPHGILKDLNIKYDNKKTLKIRRKKEIIFSLIGSLNYYKGVDLLLEAWLNDEELIKNSEIKLVIAGSGNIDFDVIKNIKNIIVINRYLENYELEEILEETDVQILPYRKISQSGVLLSILGKNKPVLVSKVGGLTQPFEIGEIGWVLDEVTSKEISSKIKLIINQKNKIKQIQNDSNLWRKIHEFYSWEKIGLQTFKCYEKLLKN